MRKPSSRNNGSKERIRRFLLAYVGEVVASLQIRDAIGTEVSEWARRLRELREDEHWPILSHNDSVDLKPGEYMFKQVPTEKKVVFHRAISAKLRAEVLDRNGSTCQMRGLCPGEIDPATRRKVRLHIGHVVDRNLGGRDELSNLRALCSSCNQGAKNVTAEKPSSVWLLSQVRRAGQEEQRAVLAYLQNKFGQS